MEYYRGYYRNGGSMDGSSVNSTSTNPSGTDQNKTDKELEKLGKDLGTVTVDGVEYKRYRKCIQRRFIQISILIKIIRLT